MATVTGSNDGWYRPLLLGATMDGTGRRYWKQQWIFLQNCFITQKLKEAPVKEQHKPLTDSCTS